MKDVKKRIRGGDSLENKLKGMMDARPGKFERLETVHSYALYRSDFDPERVQIIANGGGGYGPLFSGFIGEGLADGTCEGNHDTAPNAYALYDLARTIGAKKGVLFIANHFAGDFLNDDMAIELLAGEGIEARAAYARDDIFSAKGEPWENRGGVSGVGMLIKVAAAAARRGLTLDEVHRITEKAGRRLCSLTVLLDEKNGGIEFGPGFSGEPAAFAEPYEGAEKLAARAANLLLAELLPAVGEKLHIMVNRMCEMSYTEGYGLLHILKEELEARGYEVAGCACGQFFDAFEGNGAIMSLFAADEELERYTHKVEGHDFAV